MPILNAIVHRIEKAGDAPARLLPAESSLPLSDALDALLEGLNRAYHGKTKAWGHFAAEGSEQGSPLAGELADYLADRRDFVALTRTLAERLTALPTAHLPVSGGRLVLQPELGPGHFLPPAPPPPGLPGGPAAVAGAGPPAQPGPAEPGGRPGPRPVAGGRPPRVRLLDPGPGRQGAGRALRRPARRGGGRRCLGRDPHPAQGLQRLCGAGEPPGGDEPREDRYPHRLCQRPGQPWGADHPGGALRAARRAAAEGLLRSHSQRRLRPLAGDPPGPQDPQPVSSLHRPRRGRLDQL